MSQNELEWLTTELLSSALGQEVSGLSSAAAAPPGNNYGSLVTRVRAQLGASGRHQSLIVKSELTEGSIKDNFDLPQTCEHDFYYKFLPEASKITDTSFAPRAFPIARSESVILEDLSDRGFKMADRCAQLDFEHCRLYMMAAAKFHAVSLAVHRTRPEVVEALGDEKMFAHALKGTPIYKKMIVDGIQCFLKATRNIDKFKRVGRVFEALTDHLWDMLVDAHQPRTALNTINQGDPWTTNMMFKYDDNGVVKDVKILDFQVLRFASPVHDVLFFVWTSANHDVKNTKLPELYSIYLEHFNKHLKDFGCSEVLTEYDFMNEVRRLSPQVAFIVLLMWPLLTDPRPIEFDLFVNESEGNFFEKYYNEQFCSFHLPKAIAQMEQAGVLDYLENYLNELKQQQQ